MKVIASFLALSLLCTQVISSGVGAECGSHADCDGELYCREKRLDGWAKGVVVMEKRGTCTDGR